VEVFNQKATNLTSTGETSMLRKIAALTMLLVFGLTACRWPSPNDQQVKPGENGSDKIIQIRLPMGYIPNVQFAPFYLAVEKGYFRDAGIEIEFDYSFETDGVALVGAGELPFALVSGEQVLLARAQGLPVVYTAAWFQQYPISVVSKVDQAIKDPQDLVGKKIGLPGLFGANYVGFQALLFSAGLRETDVSLDSIGFNQVEALATDQEQAVVVYTANEPIQLNALGYELNEIRVADYARLASNGILTNEKTISEKPELVRAFVGAFLNGLADTLASPDAALEACKPYIPNFSELDPELQKQILAASIVLWETDHLGESDPQAWKNMQDVLLRARLLSVELDVSKAFTNQFIP
jgi:NitT/TauT family transport system substrate-binding protein